MRKNFDLNSNITIFRKKNRHNFIKKCCAIFVFVFFVFVFFVLIWKFVVKPKLVEKNLANFPVSFSSDGDVCLEKLSKGFCVLTRNWLNFYGKDGIRLKNFSLNLNSPKVSCNDNLVVVFDQGGSLCSLNDFETELCSVVLEDKILMAKVAENGNFAVVTGGESLFCALTVFDKKGNKLFKWNCAESLIVDFEFTNNGKGCFVCTLGVCENGFEKATVYSMNFSKSKELSKKIIDYTVPVSLKVSGSGFGLVCTDGFYFFDRNCGIVKKINFVKEWSNFCLTNKGYFVFLFDDELIIYDKFINVLGKFKLNKLVKQIKFFNNKVFVLAEDNLYVFNLRLKVLKIIEISRLADDFFCDDNYVYFLLDNRIEKCKIF